MRRGEIMYTILDLLEDGALELSKFATIVLSTGHTTSLGNMKRIERNMEEKIETRKINREKNREKERRFRKYLFKLKKDGLIGESKTEITLTEKGKKKLTEIKRKFVTPEIKKTKTLIIISYDIPHYLVTTRKHLIEFLKILEFKMVHQSLWSGNIVITEEILKEFERIEALEHMQILEVSKQGTLEKIN